MVQIKTAQTYFKNAYCIRINPKLTAKQLYFLFNVN